ncbi:MAG: hypothetical protein WD810_00925 [Solirubrobacterales bacterium]
MPAQQTYLDVTQGNRVFDSLYDSELPRLDDDCGSWWKAVEERAESAPADIVPGLLSQTIAAAGMDVRVGGGTSCTFSAHPPADGRRTSSKKLSGVPHPHVHPGRFEVRDAEIGDLSSLARNLRSDDLLVAIAKPPPAKNRALALGIAGRGFGGNLTSDSTRLDGYVLSTDVAPTVLERLGLEAPSEMSGEPIRAEGTVDAAAVASLADRMAVISHRRGPVIGLSLLAWLALLGLALAVTRGAAGRTGVRLAGLAVIYMPLALLLAAAIEPGESAEALLVMLGAPLLAALTLALLHGYRALAVASALTVAAYAVDVLLGSPLTALSLLGPNPGLGVRFYGIGNELEALLAVLVVAGTGAGLAGFASGLSLRRCAATFLVIGLVFAFVFAAGRFGADVGAAIVFPVGAAVAAAAIAGTGRRSALLVIAAPFAVLALLALVDLLSGANAHLTRSVLDAGGLGDLSDVAQRRLQLSAHSFERPVLLVFLPLVAALVALAIIRRDRLRDWLRGSPAMRAGLMGALAATAIGTLANDSGALLLEIGTAYLLVFTGFAWAEGAPSAPQTKSYNVASHTSHLSA